MERKWVNLTDWQISAIYESVRRAQQDFHLEHVSAEYLLRLLAHSNKMKINVKKEYVS